MSGTDSGLSDTESGTCGRESDTAVSLSREAPTWDVGALSAPRREDESRVPSVKLEDESRSAVPEETEPRVLSAPESLPVSAKAIPVPVLSAAPTPTATTPALSHGCPTAPLRENLLRDLVFLAPALDA